MIKTHRFVCNNCNFIIDYIPGIYFMPPCPVCGEPMESSLVFEKYSYEEYLEYIDYLDCELRQFIFSLENKTDVSDVFPETTYDTHSEEDNLFDDTFSEKSYCPLSNTDCNYSCKFNTLDLYLT